MLGKTSFTSHSRKLGAIALAAIGIVIAVLLLARHYWPFTEAAIRQKLASAASADVKFGSFRKTFFPPGCVAENVIFTRAGSGQPLISARRITISSYPGALVHGHVGTLRVDGMHVLIAPNEFSKNQVRKQTTIEHFVADDGVLEVSAKGSGAPLRFVFHRFSLGHLNGTGTSTFSAAFDNPVPAGAVEVSGSFGPWDTQNPGATPVSASYSLNHADLGAFHSIGGLLSSTGTIKGTFQRMAVEGSTHTPEFVVAKTHHSQALDTDFNAFVDAIKGDVELTSVTARFGKDVISASGSIARRDDGHRSAILELTCDNGRIEDTFYPFIRSPRSPLTGDVQFRMHVVLPSGRQPFLKKVQIASTFKIRNAKFTNPGTEIKVSRVASPPKQNETDTLANFEGAVTLQNGIARFSNLSVHDQDAAALLAGNFNLTDQRVDLHGKLKTAASLSKTTHGIKAVFAKVIEPFFKKKPHETVVPVHVGGTYSHPSFGLDLGS